MNEVAAILLGVIITAVVSIIIMLVNYWISKQALSHETARDIGKTSIDLKIKQLNELYGPLHLLIEQNKILAHKLREGKADPENWKLLDNLLDVLGNQQDKAILDEIMEINAKIEKLIIGKGGFIRSPGPPESFHLFLGHNKILKLAIEGNKERPHVSEFEYYPRELDIDVKEAYNAIRNERDEMLQKYESILKKETSVKSTL